MAFPKRTQKEKRIHYTQVASGEKAVKENSKFSEAEQRAYARGQRDARNESARICAYKNATAEQRKAYKAKKAAERAAYKQQKAAEKAAKKSNNKKAANK